jgi:hypothetical protein
MHPMLRRGVTVVILALCPAPSLRAQLPMAQMAEGPLGIPETRSGSGTSWLPDAAPLHATHFAAGAWTLMLHGRVFLEYDRQGGPRGAEQVGSVNWAMLAATRSVAGGRLELRGMMSGEPGTIGSAGYPLLLQSGESNQGLPLRDRQHPHDLVMELAALYERPLTGPLGLSLYLAPVGEPALGPVAYPHRPSAAEDPLAPIGHHWQDATHISYGVLTAGVFTRAVKLEASLFNGREPDDDRTDFDYAGRRLDSYSVRLSVNPGARWSGSVWYGYLQSPEGLYPSESLDRFGAAALTTQRLGHRGSWASAVIYGANRSFTTGSVANSVLLESTLDWDDANAVFGRAEYVQKTAQDLVIPALPADAVFPVGELTLGYHRSLATRGRFALGGGLLGSVDFVPASLAAAYGSRRPTGFAVFLSLAPRGGAVHAGMTMPTSMPEGIGAGGR